MGGVGGGGGEEGGIFAEKKVQHVDLDDFFEEGRERKNYNVTLFFFN